MNGQTARPIRTLAATAAISLAMVLTSCGSTTAGQDDQFCNKGPRARLDTSRDDNYVQGTISGTACLDSEVQEMWMLIFHNEMYWKTGTQGSPVKVGSDDRFSVRSPDTSMYPGPNSGSIIFFVTTKDGGRQLAQLRGSFTRQQLPEGGQVAGIKFF